MKGRKPKNPNLRLLRGSGTRGTDDPSMPTDRPEPPDGFEGEIKKVFGKICEHLEQLGLLARADVYMIGLLAQNFVTWKKCLHEMDSKGLTVKMTNKAGHTNEILSPHARLALMASDRIVKICGELGLSPVARMRLFVSSPNANDKDEFAALLTK